MVQPTRNTEIILRSKRREINDNVTIRCAYFAKWVFILFGLGALRSKGPYNRFFSFPFYKIIHVLSGLEGLETRFLGL